MRRRPIRPRPALLSSRSKNAFSALQRLHVQISNVGVAVRAITGTTGEFETDFEVVVEHHFVLPETARAVEDAQDALLGLHAAAGTAPGMGVEVAVVAATGDDGAEFAIAVGVLGGDGGFGDCVVFALDGTGVGGEVVAFGGFDRALA